MKRSGYKSGTVYRGVVKEGLVCSAPPGSLTRRTGHTAGLRDGGSADQRV
ncbi:hypothetical protein GCM10010344_64090 [Streptomyces bluensis]|nr:hypothetical protein GCM10010344_64090 [Streptomyces bluensis]